MHRNRLDAASQSAEFLSLRQLAKDVNVQISTQPLEIDDWPGRLSLFALTNQRGYFVAATNTGFVVAPLHALRTAFNASTPFRPQYLNHLPSKPAIIKFVCNGDRFVVSTRDGVLLVFNTPTNPQQWDSSSSSEPPPLPLVHEFSEARDPIRDIQPNPSDRPEIVAVLRGTADGTSSSWVDLVNISTLQNVGRINGGSGTAFQTCIAWSPKGKQLVVGGRNGQLVQYGQDGSQKSVLAQADGEKPPQEVASVSWLENTVFFIVYKNPEEEHDYTPVVTIHDTKAQTTTDIFVEDPSPPWGLTSRQTSRFCVHLKAWNPTKHLLFVGDGPADEIGTLASISEDGSWAKLDLDDTARATLPLDLEGTPTCILGLEVDLTSTTPISTSTQFGDDSPSLPPAPILFTYTNQGNILGYHVINSTEGVYPGMMPLDLSSTQVQDATARPKTPPSAATPQPSLTPASTIGFGSRPSGTAFSTFGTTTPISSPAGFSSGGTIPFGSNTSGSGAFGSTGFGQTNSTGTTPFSGFGSNTTTSGSGFGQSGFGTTPSTAFGQSSFGKPTQPLAFGQSSFNSTPSSSGLGFGQTSFGAAATKPTTGFGSTAPTGKGFGSFAGGTSSGFGGFATTGGSVFGGSSTTPTPTTPAPISTLAPPKTNDTQMVSQPQTPMESGFGTPTPPTSFGFGTSSSTPTGSPAPSVSSTGGFAKFGTTSFSQPTAFGQSTPMSNTSSSNSSTTPASAPPLKPAFAGFGTSSSTSTATPTFGNTTTFGGFGKPAFGSTSFGSTSFGAATKPPAVSVTPPTGGGGFGVFSSGSSFGGFGASTTPSKSFGDILSSEGTGSDIKPAPVAVFGSKPSAFSSAFSLGDKPKEIVAVRGGARGGDDDDDDDGKGMQSRFPEEVADAQEPTKYADPRGDMFGRLPGSERSNSSSPPPAPAPAPTVPPTFGFGGLSFGSGTSQPKTTPPPVGNSVFGGFGVTKPDAPAPRPSTPPRTEAASTEPPTPGTPPDEVQESEGEEAGGEGSLASQERSREEEDDEEEEDDGDFVISAPGSPRSGTDGADDEEEEEDEEEDEEEESGEALNESSYLLPQNPLGAARPSTEVTPATPSKDDPEEEDNDESTTPRGSPGVFSEAPSTSLGVPSSTPSSANPTSRSPSPNLPTFGATPSGLGLGRPSSIATRSSAFSSIPTKSSPLSSPPILADADSSPEKPIPAPRFTAQTPAPVKPTHDDDDDGDEEDSPIKPTRRPQETKEDDKGKAPQLRGSLFNTPSPIPPAGISVPLPDEDAEKATKRSKTPPLSSFGLGFGNPGKTAKAPPSLFSFGGAQPTPVTPAANQPPVLNFGRPSTTPMMTPPVSKSPFEIPKPSTSAPPPSLFGTSTPKPMQPGVEQPTAPKSSSTPPLFAPTPVAPTQNKPLFPTANAPAPTPAPAPAPAPAPLPTPAPPPPAPLTGMEAEFARVIALTESGLEQLRGQLAKFKHEQGRFTQNMRVDFPGGRTTSVALTDLKGIKLLMSEVREDGKTIGGTHLETKKRIADMESLNLRVETTKEEVGRYIRARSDPEFAKMIKIRHLGPEHAENQQRLRKVLHLVSDRVQQLEDIVAESKKNVDLAKNGRKAMQAPTLDMIARSLTRIQRGAQGRVEEINKLVERLAMLDMSEPSSPDVEFGYVDIAPSKKPYANRSDASSSKPSEPSTIIRQHAAAALNAERAGARLKETLLSLRDTPRLNSSVRPSKPSQAPPALRTSLMLDRQQGGAALPLWTRPEYGTTGSSSTSNLGGGGVSRNASLLSSQNSFSTALGAQGAEQNETPKRSIFDVPHNSGSTRPLSLTRTRPTSNNRLPQSATAPSVTGRSFGLSMLDVTTGLDDEDEWVDATAN